MQFYGLKILMTRNNCLFKINWSENATERKKASARVIQNVQFCFKNLVTKKMQFSGEHSP